MTGSGRNSPVVSPALGPIKNISPVSTPICSRSAPSSAPNTPRSLTPDDGYRSESISRHNSEDFDSQAGMKATVEAIEEIIIKCSNILKAREVEDVKRKVEIMKQQWSEEKLSVPVQITMKMLTEALLCGDTDTSHKLHVKLMVDYVGEVKQWMVAIKRLISAVGNINTTIS
ncbi:steroid receptor RNA activator 1-like [Dendronephthya gigantea]|uniref:steroid receptor RNA activator 1-like n=1 Tax=Dendronephthya gigantea TaxID=151771 RepID=UPI00106940EB|nr:steroid receptor RNA activator 1-like [Dendronephthya gigantea]